MFILRQFVIFLTQTRTPMAPCGDIFYVRSLKKFLLRILRYDKLQFLIRKKNILNSSSIFTCPFLYFAYINSFLFLFLSSEMQIVYEIYDSWHYIEITHMRTILILDSFLLMLKKLFNLNIYDWIFIFIRSKRFF